MMMSAIATTNQTSYIATKKQLESKYSSKYVPTKYSNIIITIILFVEAGECLEGGQKFSIYLWVFRIGE